MTPSQTIAALYASPEPLFATRRENVRLNTQSFLLRNLAEYMLTDDLDTAIQTTTKPLIDGQRVATNQANITVEQRTDFETLVDLAIADAVVAVHDVANGGVVGFDAICFAAATRLGIPIA